MRKTLEIQAFSSRPLKKPLKPLARAWFLEGQKPIEINDFLKFRKFREILVG